MTLEDKTIRAESGHQYFLKHTSIACPEQYDVFLNKRTVAYLRLRHGEFRAECPVCGGLTVYESRTLGDGAFDDEEQSAQLNAAIEKIDQWVSQNPI